MKPPTLKTIAEASGLSVSTVSLALRNDGRVTKKTRREVELLALKLGYRPNAAGAILAGFRTGKTDRNAIIALVTSAEEPNLADEFYHHVQTAGQRRGYQMEHWPIGRNSETQGVINRLFNRGVSGVLLSFMRRPDVNLFEFDWSQFSTVALLRSRHFCPYDLITADSFFTMRECWRQVRARGYRRIGVALCGHQPLMEDDLYREGALAVCTASLNAKEQAIPPFLGLHDDAEGLLAWFRHHRPDAVIGFHAGHYRILKEAMPAPKKLRFAALYTSPESAEISGCVRNEEIEISMAINHIDELIRHRHRGLPAAPREILVRPTWQEGSTLGNPS